MHDDHFNLLRAALDDERDGGCPGPRTKALFNAHGMRRMTEWARDLEGWGYLRAIFGVVKGNGEPSALFIEGVTDSGRRVIEDEDGRPLS